VKRTPEEEQARRQRQANSRQALQERPCANRCGNIVGMARFQEGGRLCSVCEERAEAEQREAKREAFLEFLEENEDVLRDIVENYLSTR
jgi:hypothetical protein